MPTAFSQRFLTVASAALFLLMLVSYYSAISNGNTHDWGWEIHVNQLLTISSMLLLAVFLEVAYQKRTELAKNLALALIILQGLLILFRFYSMGSVFFEQDFGSVKYFIYTIIGQLSYLLLPVGLFITGINYFTKGELLTFSNRVLLVLYAVSALISRFFFLILYFVAKAKNVTYFYNDSMYDQIYYLLELVFNAALLTFLFSNLTQLTQIPESEKHPDLLDAETAIFPKQDATTVSVMWWFGKYLLLMIPLVNIVFLLIWSGKNQPRLLRNWSVGHYCVTCLAILLSIFLIYNSGDSEPIVTIGMLLIPVVLIVVGIVLLARADQSENVTDDSPGIGTWVGRIFLAAIPLIGWIFLIINATDQSDKTRQNWAKSQLLLIAVNVIFYISYLSAIDQIQNMLSYTEFAF